MIRFNCDYCEGAHPRILEKLLQTNLVQTAGYGEDEYCREAADIIRRLCQAPDAAVHFLVGGTQTNLTVLCAALRPWQGVIAAETGHIAAHESGAIEATGHKVLTLPHRGRQNFRRPDRVHLRRTLGRRHARAHGHARSGLSIASHRIRNALHASRNQRNPRRVRSVRVDSLPRRSAPGIRPGRRGKRFDPALPCPDHRRFLHRRHQTGRAVWGSGGPFQPLSRSEFPLSDQAKGRMLAKGRLLGIQFAELLRDGLYFSLPGTRFNWPKNCAALLKRQVSPS